jgi:hypothetical protein
MRWRNDANSLQSDINIKKHVLFETRDDQISWQDRAWRELNTLARDLNAFNGPEKLELNAIEQATRQAYHKCVETKDSEYEERRRAAEEGREGSSENPTSRGRIDIARHPKDTDSPPARAPVNDQREADTRHPDPRANQPDAAHRQAGHRREGKLIVMNAR